MADEAPEATEEPKKKRGKKTIIIPVVMLLIGLGVGGYFFMTGKSKGAEAASEATTTTIAHGKLVRLKPITLNLSDGHVLKVGIAMQLIEKPEDEHLAAIVTASAGGHGSGGTTEVPDSPLDGLEAKALDQAIQTLGDSTFAQLSKPGGKLHAKEELSHKIQEQYHGDVVEVYFTDFVMS